MVFIASFMIYIFRYLYNKFYGGILYQKFDKVLYKRLSGAVISLFTKFVKINMFLVICLLLIEKLIRRYVFKEVFY